MTQAVLSQRLDDLWRNQDGIQGSTSANTRPRRTTTRFARAQEKFEDYLRVTNHTGHFRDLTTPSAPLRFQDTAEKPTKEWSRVIRRDYQWSNLEGRWTSKQHHGRIVRRDEIFDTILSYKRSMKDDTTDVIFRYIKDHVVGIVRQDVRKALALWREYGLGELDAQDDIVWGGIPPADTDRSRPNRVKGAPPRETRGNVPDRPSEIALNDPDRGSLDDFVDDDEPLASSQASFDPGSSCSIKPSPSKISTAAIPSSSTVADLTPPPESEPVQEATKRKRRQPRAKVPNVSLDDLPGSDSDDVPLVQNRSSKKQKCAAREASSKRSDAPDTRSEIQDDSAQINDCNNTGPDTAESPTTPRATFSTQNTQISPLSESLLPDRITSTELLVTLTSHPAIYPITIPLAECLTLKEFFKSIEQELTDLFKGCNLPGASAVSDLYAAMITYPGTQEKATIRRVHARSQLKWSIFVNAIIENEKGTEKTKRCKSEVIILNG